MNISVVDLITSPCCPCGAELVLLPVKRNQDPLGAVSWGEPGNPSGTAGLGRAQNKPQDAPEGDSLCRGREMAPGTGWKVGGILFRLAACSSLLCFINVNM